MCISQESLHLRLRCWWMYNAYLKKKHRRAEVFWSLCNYCRRANPYNDCIVNIVLVSAVVVPNWWRIGDGLLLKPVKLVFSVYGRARGLILVTMLRYAISRDNFFREISHSPKIVRYPLWCLASHRRTCAIPILQHIAWLLCGTPQRQAQNNFAILSLQASRDMRSIAAGPRRPSCHSVWTPPARKPQSNVRRGIPRPLYYIPSGTEEVLTVSAHWWGPLGGIFRGH